MTLGIIGNTSKAEAPTAIRSLIEILDRRSVPFLIQDQLVEAFTDLEGLGQTVPMEELIARSSVAIAFGGDGTMLSTSRLLAGTGVPLLGINLGKLGFLAEFSVTSLDQTIDDLLSGACRIVERSLLRAAFPDNPDQEPLIGLNDIVIDKQGAGLMLQLETYINGDYLGTYNADGLIIATPTGSTAYALAVGGPVVTPSAEVTVIAPIAPHMLTARPVVVPDTAVIDIYPVTHRGDRMAHVYADGQDHRNIPVPTRVSITRHDQVACLVKRTSRTYFDVLRAKLLWGREPVLNVRPDLNEGKL